jgi:alpha-beta hydrolase superfamily lysophospholipase
MSASEQRARAEETFFVSGENRLFGNYWRSRSGAPTIVLLHGLGFHGFEYETLAPLLFSTGFDCFAFDFRCHGRSEGPRGVWKLDDLVEDARHALDFLQQRDVGPIGVFGNSLGAIVGVHLAASDARVASLVASGCPTRVADFAVTPLRRALLALLKPASRVSSIRVSVNWFEPYSLILSDPAVIARIEADGLISDARRLAPATCEDLFAWNALAAASNLRIPLLVLAATQDRLQPVRQSELLFEAAAGSKEQRLIDTSSHVPNLEHPALLRPILADWFQRTLLPQEGSSEPLNRE